MAIIPLEERSRKVRLARALKRRINQKFPERWYVDEFGGKLTDLQWSAFGGAYETHKWDGTPDPLLEVFKALARKEWVGIESGTGTGKTWEAARITAWFLNNFENSIVVTTAPKLAQLKTVLWTEIGSIYPKFRELNPMSELYNLALYVNRSDANKDPDAALKNAHMAIGMVAGVGADEESAVKMQGIHRPNMLFIIDEGAGVSTAIYKAVENTSSDVEHYNLVVSMGNPDSQIDPLHKFCRKARVTHIRISALDHPNVVLNKAVIPGAVTCGSIAIRKEEYGENSRFYGSRVRGLAPAEAADSLIHLAWVEQCTPWHENWANVPEIKGHNGLGVDVANSENGDQASLAWFKANRCFKIHAFQCVNANALANNIVQSDFDVARQGLPRYGTDKIFHHDVYAECIGVDVVGVGAGTINELWKLGVKAISLQGGQHDAAIKQDAEGKPLYEFANLRSQMWFEAMLDLQHKRLILDIEDRRLWNKLAEQLVTPKFILKSNKIYIESKKDIIKRTGGGSPNEADSFVYGNFLRKHYYRTSVPRPFR